MNPSDTATGRVLVVDDMPQNRHRRSTRLGDALAEALPLSRSR